MADLAWQIVLVAQQHGRTVPQNIDEVAEVLALVTNGLSDADLVERVWADIAARLASVKR